MGPQAAPSGQAPTWTRTPRIAAAVIVAPGIGFAFEPAGLAAVQAPVQLWAGGADDTVPAASNADLVRRLLPRAPEFHEVDGAVHYSFLAPCTPQSPPMLCQDRPGFDRAAFHRELNQAVIGFLRARLH
jgi:predicted dienelactone hydrolase